MTNLSSQVTEDGLKSSALSNLTDKYVLDTLAVIRTLVDKYVCEGVLGQPGKASIIYLS